MYTSTGRSQNLFYLAESNVSANILTDINDISTITKHKTESIQTGEKINIRYNLLLNF